MAHNDKLAGYLFTSSDMLPAIFGCMSAPSAAFAVRKNTLEIADTLVARAHELGLEEDISSHMSVLLQHVYLHLKLLVDKGGPRAAASGLATPQERMQAMYRETGLLRLQFNMLAKLSRYECTPLQAQLLLDLLLPFLGTRKKFGNVSASEEARRRILETCANLVEVVEDSSAYVAAASRQLLPAVEPQTRAAACAFVVAIGRPLELVAQLILDLNSMSEKRLDEYDFDKRLAAYSQCGQPEFLGKMTAAHVRVLASQCMHDFRDADVSIRNHAVKLLLLLLMRIKDAAACSGGAATSMAGGGHVGAQPPGSARGAGADLWEVYLDVVYPALKMNLRDRKRDLRNEAFKMVMKAGGLFGDFHADLRVLTHVDPEQDISLNLLHIQMHRRIKALMSLTKTVQAGTLSVGSLRWILMPLVWWSIIDPRDKGKDEKKAYQSEDGAYNLSEEAVRTAAAIAQQLPWKEYQVMLSDAQRELGMSRPYEKVLVKLICAIVGSFHFELDASAEAQIVRYTHVLGVTDTPLALEAAGREAALDAAADLKRRQIQIAEKFDTGDDDEEDDVDREVQEGVSVGAPRDAKGFMTEVGGVVETYSMEALAKKIVVGEREASAGDIYLHVVYKLLPELEKQMTEKAEFTGVDRKVQQGKLRPAMAVAVVKLLKLLPEERMRARLPHIIGVVCNGLRVREQGDRDATRKTLADIMRTLGPMFLHFVLGEVRSNLSVGYQRHVCGYTFYSLLDSLRDMLGGAQLLPSMPVILEVFLSELVGTIAEEKEVDKIVAKTKEAKSSKAYDCMEVIGSVLAFELMSAALFEPEAHEWGLRTQIHAAATLKQRQKMEELLRRLGLGLAANPSLSTKDMLIWVHKQVALYLPACAPAPKSEVPSEMQSKEEKDKLRIGESARGVGGVLLLQKRSALLEKRPEPAVKLPPMGPEWERRSRAREGATMLEKSRTAVTGEAANVNRNEYLIAELALTLLHTCLKRGTVDFKVKINLEMLDPFVEVCKRLMLSKHDSLVVLALKVLALLLPLHLPAMQEELPGVVRSIFFLLQRGGATASLTMQACFKALTVLLREAKGKLQLSPSQLKVLLSFAKLDILESGRQAVAFGLVRAIIARKLVCEEVYELVDTISEHMVTSQSEQTRALSAHTLLQFLLEFPMGDKRLHAHITSLVRNLDYGYESGRKVVLEVMARLAVKLPQALMDQYLELLFLPLVTRLVNDDSSTCRSMVGLLLKQLLARAQSKQLDTLLDMILEWLGGGEALLRRAAAQVLGLLVEQQGTAAERYMQRVLAALASAASLSLDSIEGGGEWESLYHLLNAAEKLHAACKKLVHTPGYFEEAGQLLAPRVLHHRHQWVQLAAARLLGRALGMLDSEAAGGKALRQLLKACGGAFLVIRGICAQVAKVELDQRLSDQLVRNLLHLGSALQRDHSLVKDADVTAAQERDREEEEEEEGGQGEEEEEEEEEEEVSVDSKTREGANGAVVRVPGEDGQEMEVQVVEPVRAVKWLFQRLSHIGRRHNGLRRSCVFQFFAAMGVRMGAGALVPLLTNVTAPLYRAIEVDMESSQEERCKELAEEVVEVLQGITGHDLFHSAYNACRARQRLRKDQRRSEKALKKLLDPQGAAVARIGKNKRKIKSKKRKIEGHKEARGAKKTKNEDL